MAKALGWQRLRTNNPTDPFFQEFAKTCLDGFDHGIRTLGKPGESPSRQPSDVIYSGDPVNDPDWVSVPCFRLALEVVSRLTSKSLFGKSDFWDDPGFLAMCCQYADAVPRDAMALHCVPSFSRQ